MSSFSAPKMIETGVGRSGGGLNNFEPRGMNRTGISGGFDRGGFGAGSNVGARNLGGRTDFGNRVNGNFDRINNANLNGTRWNNPYSGYHQGWVHGYWSGHNANRWGWDNRYWGWGTGLGLGWGLAAWGYGGGLYNWGYMPYYDPYYVASPVVVDQPVAAYDYSQPIDTTSTQPEQSVTDQAVQLFDAARASFKQGDYAQALQQCDQALAKMPNDPALHEFRALVLFALRRYDEAAAALYAVLSVGPGWDWTTLISLYPSVDVYTEQLRALESYCLAHPDSASARFVLAYQYLTEGHNDAAVNALKWVVKLKPDDGLSKQLLQQLSAQNTGTDQAPPEAAPANTAPPAGATLEGTWTARPSKDTTVTLTIKPGGSFTWRVQQKGQPREFSGTSTYGDGILTLAPANGPALVGNVSWQDPTHMTFHVVGDSPDNPGLSFSK
jgi:Tfp pilus assembly protein PilF